MSNPFARARRRALSVGTAFALVPVVLTGALTLAARPSLALQDAKTDVKDDKTYTITRNYSAKEVNHYKIGVNIKANIPLAGGDVNIVMAMLMKEAVKSVKDDGTATLQSDFDSATMKFNDMETEITSSLPKVTTTIDKYGHLLDTKVEGGAAQFTEGQGSQMLNSINQPGLYPAKAVKIGESWKIEPSKAKAGDKNASKINGTATLVGLETIDGVQTLKIKTVIDSEASMDNPTAPGDKMDIKAHTLGFSNVDVVSGKLIKATASTESEGSILGKSTSEMSLSLVKDDGKTKPEKKADKKASE